MHALALFISCYRGQTSSALSFLQRTSFLLILVGAVELLGRIVRYSRIHMYELMINALDSM